MSDDGTLTLQQYWLTLTPFTFYLSNIGIKHVFFSCINVCQVPREMLKIEAEGRGFQQFPRDLANVNALETIGSVKIRCS